MRKLNYHVEKFGNELEPVVIIDNFLGDIQALIKLAETSEFIPVQGFPGSRAATNVNYLSQCAEALADILYDIFGFKYGFRSESCDFSIVSTPAEQLHISQRIPHYDDTHADLLAFLHYLNGCEQTGTAFYRHIRTGFETVDASRASTYKKALMTDDTEFGFPPLAYCYGDSERYELIGEVEAVPDRLIIYRGKTLHSGIIHPTALLTNDPRCGRLTLNTFIRSITTKA
jgi:hypothetical protein